MSSSTSSFKTVLRGYDPAEVDAHIATLKEHAKGLRNQITEVENKLAAVTEPNFAHLGDRVGQILTLAEEESAELRKRTAKEIERQRTDAADAVRKLRKEADAYAVATRTEADDYAQATRDEADAYALTTRTEADEYARTTRDAADQEAARIVSEAAEKAAAVTGAAQTELDRITAEQQRVLAEHEQEMAGWRAKAEAERTEAERLDRERADEAHRQATAIVAEAQQEAERIRLEAEREVAEIERRSESINAQLANVRRALAHLTGDDVQEPQGSLFEVTNDQS
ncbi:DivIVA domain-containing protein [Aeromicrobium sp. 636]|uniref:DivIVA domain-containing protein n=1 Tax=Aeromicrobium senzhongii TaxID=2663859 RepID=A0A8I0EW08_9ACTN|nr:MULTISPECIES: DivIVA domain-containing protein [Aeromicrobium]MBC9227265.1 DivIVA domain-containing protein [Aeromicrobium senzhongii]MCQ3999363.1 DivIVA domain-containing protein [Aeromicrobium sp. 636]MTB88325.1 DivIVA domain-containing protein [Aeromicrobium senzhongii]QNL94699.1 DivIVA domain-containing protein [Aeromicrobium senzhongii]